MRPKKTTEELVLQVVENELPHVYARLGTIETEQKSIHIILQSLQTTQGIIHQEVCNIFTAMPANKRWAAVVAVVAIIASLAALIQIMVS
jgi:hypothetical protein